MLRTRSLDTVTILGYRTMEKDGKPVERRDGSVVEFVQFGVNGEDRYRDLVLDSSVNGSRAPEGAQVELLIEEKVEASAQIGRDGRPYIRHDVKRRVTGFADPAKR